MVIDSTSSYAWIHMDKFEKKFLSTRKLRMTAYFSQDELTTYSPYSQAERQNWIVYFQT